MLPIILLAGASAGVFYWRKHRKKTTKISGMLTPARAEIHTHLMGYEYDPKKLDKAAKLFGNEGLRAQAFDLAGKAAQIRKQAQGAAELCQRARKLDQNAIGMIAAIREEAARGSARAVVSANLIADYCKKHPAPPIGPLGESPMAAPHGEGDEAAA